MRRKLCTNNQQKNTPYGIIAGIFFGIWALLGLQNLPSALSGVSILYTSIWLITEVGLIWSAIMLFMKKRNDKAAVGFYALTIAFLFNVFVNGAIFSFLDNSGYASLSIVAYFAYSNLDGNKATAKKIWYIPILLALIGAVLTISRSIRFDLAMTSVFVNVIIRTGAVIFTSLWFAKSTK